MADVYASPFGTYADATGVVDATAAAEIVALFAELSTFITQTAGQSMPHTDFDQMTPQLAERLQAEVDAVAAAIAAAPAT